VTDLADNGVVDGHGGAAHSLDDGTHVVHLRGRD
jgi:hypothetical protein